MSTVRMATAKRAASKKTAFKKAARKAKAPTKKPAAKKATLKKRSAAKRKPSAAFMKPIISRADLVAVVGNKATPPTEITKKIMDYVQKNRLQDKTNRRILAATLAPRSLTGPQIMTMVKDTMIKWVK